MFFHWYGKNMLKLRGFINIFNNQVYEQKLPRLVQWIKCDHMKSKIKYYISTFEFKYI